jgi:hypothetical protein
VRTALGAPVDVSSAFRCLTLNRAIGSEDGSAHVQGWAADIEVKGRTVAQVVTAIRAADLPFDQLIAEGTWTHWGLRQPHTGAQRAQCFSLLLGLAGKRVVSDFDPADPRVQVLA